MLDVAFSTLSICGDGGEEYIFLLKRGLTAGLAYVLRTLLLVFNTQRTPDTLHRLRRNAMLHCVNYGLNYVAALSLNNCLFTPRPPGHEDLRQDERVMQLFGLVNNMLASDRWGTRLSLLTAFVDCFCFDVFGVPDDASSRLGVR